MREPVKDSLTDDIESWFSIVRGATDLLIRILTCILFLIIIPFAGYSQLANSQWPSYRYNSQNTGRSPYVGVQSNDTLKWTYATGATGKHSTPLIGPDGTIYVTTWFGYIHAVNPDGTKKWSYETGHGDAGSAPAIDSSGTIYFGSDDIYDSTEGELYALKPNGDLKWTYKTEEPLGDSSPQIGKDGTIYIAAQNKLHAVNSDGSQKWVYKAEEWINTEPGYKIAMGEDGFIYAGTGYGSLIKLNQEGSRIWRYDSISSISSLPAISHDGTIYVGSKDSTLHAVNPDGSKKWSYKTQSAILSNIALDRSGVIYFTSRKEGYRNQILYAVHSDGTLKWTKEINGETGPILGGNGNIYIIAGNGHLEALRPNGSLLWRSDMSFDWGPVLGVGGCTICY